jgi:hypothetical protein
MPLNFTNNAWYYRNLSFCLPIHSLGYIRRFRGTEIGGTVPKVAWTEKNFGGITFYSDPFSVLFQVQFSIWSQYLCRTTGGSIPVKEKMFLFKATPALALYSNQQLFRGAVPTSILVSMLRKSLHLSHTTFYHSMVPKLSFTVTIRYSNPTCRIIPTPSWQAVSVHIEGTKICKCHPSQRLHI